MQHYSKKFGTNLGAWAFFFLGFTHRHIIETANSFVLNTLLPCRRERFAGVGCSEFLQSFPANCMVTNGAMRLFCPTLNYQFTTDFHGQNGV